MEHGCWYGLDHPCIRTARASPILHIIMLLAASSRMELYRQHYLMRPTSRRPAPPARTSERATHRVRLYRTYNFDGSKQPYYCRVALLCKAASTRTSEPRPVFVVTADRRGKMHGVSCVAPRKCRSPARSARSSSCRSRQGQPATPVRHRRARIYMNVVVLVVPAAAAGCSFLAIHPSSSS